MFKYIITFFLVLGHLLGESDSTDICNNNFLNEEKTNLSKDFVQKSPCYDETQYCDLVSIHFFMYLQDEMKKLMENIKKYSSIVEYDEELNHYNLGAYEQTFKILCDYTDIIFINKSH